MIEDSLTSISNIMFRQRNLWYDVPDSIKEKYFFIINRYLSKKYPKLSFLLNDKKINYLNGMEIIFQFMKDKPYPSFLWTKSTNKSNIGALSKDDKLLISKLDIDEEDLNFLKTYFPNDIKEELKYFKSLEKK